ncbi:MAG: serine/threonine-protein kinase [Deltaproteobacteria bacterium]|nr:serine/threonine-protein kinase [Deltaproteobacteria bacterium]
MAPPAESTARERWLRWIHPELGLPAEAQASTNLEACERNHRRAQVGASLLALGHVGAIGLEFSQSIQHELARPYRPQWLALHAVGVVVMSATWAFFRHRATTRQTNHPIGALFACLVLLDGVLVSSLNLGRAGHAQYLIVTMLVIPSTLSIRPARFSLAVVLAALTFAAFCENSLGTSALRATGPSLFLACVAAIAIAITHWRANIREQLLSFKAQQIEDGLDVFIQEQTAALIAQESEVARLNSVLSDRVRDHARELAAVLERISRGEVTSSPLAIGAVIDHRYEIQGELGRGGMGIVYEALDLQTRAAVAIKVLRRHEHEELDAMRSLLKEAELIAMLQHPAIVRTEQVSVTSDGSLFLVLERVAGRTLAAALRADGSWASGRIARLGEQICDALSTAHQAGISHLDIKPENVMLCEQSPGVRVLDFGLSQLRSATQKRGTHDRDFAGTPEFMTPEQWLAPESIGTATDIYALGLVLYRTACGKSPYLARNAGEWLARHAFAIPTPILEVAPHLDVELAACIMSCLEKAPVHRPTAHELSTKLGKIAERLLAPSIHEVERDRRDRRLSLA